MRKALSIPFLLIVIIGFFLTIFTTSFRPVSIKINTVGVLIFEKNSASPDNVTIDTLSGLIRNELDVHSESLVFIPVYWPDEDPSLALERTQKVIDILAKKNVLNEIDIYIRINPKVDNVVIEMPDLKEKERIGVTYYVTGKNW